MSRNFNYEIHLEDLFTSTDIFKKTKLIILMSNLLIWSILAIIQSTLKLNCWLYVKTVSFQVLDGKLEPILMLLTLDNYVLLIVVT